MKGLTDFTDWLSPMLVKELRQGVRSRIFVYTLLLLQGSLMLLTMVGLIASDAEQESEGVNYIFWVLAGAFLILFLPLSGLTAISNERTGNTLELIFLTRLSSRRIVAGKWLAIVAQIILLVFTILPYLVLRYFLGGVDLGWELLMIGGLLLSSVALSAITVGLSPLPAILTRIVFVLGLFICIYLLVAGMIFIAMGRGAIMGRAFSASKDGVAVVLESAFVIILMLEFGAARIGPPAENHSSPLRLIGLAAIAAAIIVDCLLFNSYRAISAFCLTLPILIGALCEAPREIVNIYRPFVRRGFFGKAAGRLLYPGWPSAVPYTVLVLLALGLDLCLRSLPQNRAWSALVAVTVAGTLLFPAAIVRLFGGRIRYPMALFLGVQAICVVLYSLASVLANFKIQDLRPMLDLIPTCEALNIIFGRVEDPLPDLVLVGSATFFCVIALLVRSGSAWREIHALEKKAASMKDATGDPAAIEGVISPAA